MFQVHLPLVSDVSCVFRVKQMSNSLEVRSVSLRHRTEERTSLHYLESMYRREPRTARTWEGSQQWNPIEAVSQVERRHMQLNYQISRSAVVPGSNWRLTVPDTVETGQEGWGTWKGRQHEKCWVLFEILRVKRACLTRDWLGSRRLCCDGCGTSWLVRCFEEFEKRIKGVILAGSDNKMGQTQTSWPDGKQHAVTWTLWWFCLWLRETRSTEFNLPLTLSKNSTCWHDLVYVFECLYSL